MTKKDDPWKEWEEIGLKREEYISLDWAKALIVKIVFWIVAFFIFSVIYTKCTEEEVTPFVPAEPLPPFENPYEKEIMSRPEVTIQKTYKQVNWEEIPEEELKYYQFSSTPYYE